MKNSTSNPALRIASAKAATQFLALKRVIAAGGPRSSIGPFPLRKVLAARGVALTKP
jgi:hypothetical protein